MKLWSFKGGLPALAEHKNDSSPVAIETAPVPSTLVYPLRQHIGNPAKPLVAVGEHVLRGQKIAEADGFVSAPIHASSSGVISDISEQLFPHPSGLSCQSISIKTDGLDQEVEAHSHADFRQLSILELVNIVHDAGIVGLGGAAFPSYIKIDNHSHDWNIHTLILNGAECEPYISCDNSLLMERAQCVTEGIEILLHMLGAKKAILAIEDHAELTFAHLTKTLSDHNNEAIQVVQIPTIYPTGGEKQLIQTLTGREVPSGKIPANIGIVCINVGTVYAIQQAVVKGKVLTSRVVTVTGDGVSTPKNLEARIGTPISQLIDVCHGYTPQAERLIAGGPMMGFALSSDEIPLIKASNCVLVASKEEVVTHKQAMPCIRCGECASVCPVSLLPQQLYWHSRSDQLDKAASFNLLDCIECGSCDIACPSHIPLVQHFRYAKSMLKAQQHEKQQSDTARIRFEAREARIARDKAERAEKSRKKKAALKSKPVKDDVDTTVAKTTIPSSET